MRDSVILELRRRIVSAEHPDQVEAVTSAQVRTGREAAVIICDMWDDHWCAASAQRVDEMAPVMDEVVALARERGLFIIHAPSDTMEFYAGTPQRRRAAEAPVAPPPSPSLSRLRIDEPPLPIDDSDGGCDSGDPVYKAWTRQTAAIQIEAGDAVTDSGDEVYNLLKEREITSAIMMGVHTNMCILKRSFGIRRLLNWGIDMVLMRDMTDTMYNPVRAPFVSHFEGTDLVVGHIETYLCPTITSAAFTGRAPFRFRADVRPTD